MKKKVIVYGLGHDFKVDYNDIHAQYQVIGYCDKDEKKLQKFAKGRQIKREVLHAFIHECDCILITSSLNRMDIMHDLILNCDIPMEKIWFFRHLGALEKGHGTYIKPTFYGQFCDDGILWGLLSRLGYNLQEIKYLEIGANDPVLSNNTYFFYNLGARGTLVDPLKTSMFMCEAMRPEDKFIRAAVSNESGDDVTLFCGVAAQGTSMHEQFASGKHKITAPKLGINDLLEEIGYVPELLVIDAEGEDENIIRAIDFHKYKPVVIELEVNKVENCNEGLFKAMNDFGYNFFAHIGSNAIFVETKKFEKLNWPS